MMPSHVTGAILKQLTTKSSTAHTLCILSIMLSVWNYHTEYW